jgi:hypothetical protein
VIEGITDIMSKKNFGCCFAFSNHNQSNPTNIKKKNNAVQFDCLSTWCMFGITVDFQNHDEPLLLYRSYALWLLQNHNGSL